MYRAGGTACATNGYNSLVYSDLPASTTYLLFLPEFHTFSLPLLAELT
jgi:hypothetical protein